MSFPKEIAAAVGASPYEFGSLAIGRECAGSRFHSPTPLVLNQIVLNPAWVQTIRPGDRYHGDHRTEWLCSTCADNVHVYLRLLESTEGNVPWEVRREFGNMIRSLGDEAWASHVKLQKKEPVHA